MTIKAERLAVSTLSRLNDMNAAGRNADRLAFLRDTFDDLLEQRVSGDSGLRLTRDEFEQIASGQFEIVDERGEPTNIWQQPPSAGAVPMTDPQQPDWRERPIEQLRATLSMLCHFIWHRHTRPGEHMWSIPVDKERDFDCILSDAISELEHRRALSAGAASKPDTVRLSRPADPNLLDEWREQDRILQEIAGLCDSDEHVGEPKDVLQAVRDTLTRLIAAGAVPQPRWFPIQGGPKILWGVIEPHERQADRNHGQTLEGLAQRGGLSPCEAVAVLEDRDWRRMPDEEALARLHELNAVSEYQRGFNDAARISNQNADRPSAGSTT